MKPFPHRQAASVLDFLHRHDAAASLLPAAQRILKLREDVLTVLPAPLRNICEVTAFDDETVSLRVSSAGAAAKLRQTLPRLRDALIQRGWKVSAIRIRVQPGGSAVVSTTWRAPSQAAIPMAGVDAFAALDRTLDQSPLKAAVRRLIERRRA